MPKPTSCGGAHLKGGRPKPSLIALSGFASAKASTYDKQARKQKERALNSKVVNKYRKLKARLQAPGGKAFKHHGDEGPEEQQSPRRKRRQEVAAAGSTGDGDQHDAPLGKRPKHGGEQKKVPHLQRIAQEKEAERAEAQREKEEKRRAAEARRGEQAKVQQRRKQQSALFRKKTRTGQPVMKYRIGKVLEQLQSEGGKA